SAPRARIGLSVSTEAANAPPSSERLYGFENAIFRYGRFSKMACFAKSVAVSRTACASFGEGTPDWLGLIGSTTKGHCTGWRFGDLRRLAKSHLLHEGVPQRRDALPVRVDECGAFEKRARRVGRDDFAVVADREEVQSRRQTVGRRPRGEIDLPGRGVGFLGDLRLPVGRRVGIGGIEDVDVEVPVAAAIHGSGAQSHPAVHRRVRACGIEIEIAETVLRRYAYLRSGDPLRGRFLPELGEHEHAIVVEDD